MVVTDWARATGTRVWEGELPTIDFGDARVDVVRFNHVLEHTRDPLLELRRARQLVAPGGILLVGVPNLAGLSTLLKSWQSRLRLKGKPWKHYSRDGSVRSVDDPNQIFPLSAWHLPRREPAGSLRAR